MASMTDSDVRDFLQHGTRTGKLAYTGGGHRPLVAPVWFVVEGEEIVFNTGKGTAKGKSLQRDPRTTLLVDLEENPTTAEMIKYTANSFLALTISYANEIARICENLDNVDSEEVFRGVFFDKRISPIVKNKRVFPELTTYLRSGCGFGGSCLPKDVKALLAFEKELGVQGSLLDGILSINKSQTEHIFQYGIRSFNGNARNITILGTAFKPNTDDVRESPGIKIAKIALNKGLRVTVHDFIALDNTKRIFGNKIYYFENPLEAIREADIIFVTTIWDEYLNISDEEFEKNMKPHAVMIDCRSLYRGRENKSWRKRIGFNYNPPA